VLASFVDGLLARRPLSAAQPTSMVPINTQAEAITMRLARRRLCMGWYQAGRAASPAQICSRSATAHCSRASLPLMASLQAAADRMMRSGSPSG